jgi:hypothetical protein
MISGVRLPVNIKDRISPLFYQSGERLGDALDGFLQVVH